MKDEEFGLRIWCALMAGFLVGYLCCAIIADEIIGNMYDAIQAKRRAEAYRESDNAGLATPLEQDGERGA